MAKIAAVKKPKIASIAKNIVVNAKTFRAALDMGVADRKTTVPILSNVLFQPHGKTTLRLVTTDLDEMVISEIDAVSTIKEPFTLPWRKVIDLLKGEDGPITFTPLEDHYVKMSTGGVDYKLIGMSAKNYPAVPEIPKPTFQLPGKMLKEMLAHTTFAISAEESRYTLNGALLRFMTDAFLIAATDGHRLAMEKRQLDLSVDGETKSAIVRAVPLAWLQKRLGDSNVGITLDTDAIKGSTVFHLPHLDTTFITRKLTGQFPNYDAIMPQKKSLKSFVSFGSADVVHGLLTKVAKCADERSKAVRIHMNGAFTFSASSTESGEAKAVVSENAMVSACRYVAGINMTYATGAFHVDADMIEIRNAKPVMREDVVRLNNGPRPVSDLRYRAEFPSPWKMTIPITFNQNAINAQSIANLLNIAGQNIGVGEWRPERKGNFGRFRVTGFVGEQQVPKGKRA